MKTEIFSHYSNVLDNLIDKYNFAKYYFQEPFFLENSLFEDGLTICSGVTRGCIIDNNYDWVIKYDLWSCGVYTCEKEVNIYRAAMREGVEKFFVEPIYLGTYCRSFEFFNVQSFCDNYEWVNSFNEEIFLKEVEEMVSLHLITIELPLYAYRRALPFCPMEILDAGKVRRELGVSSLTEKDIAVGAEFARVYQMNEYNKLVSFLEEEGVNDLHSANVGTIAGKPVLIDYCGGEEDY